MSSVVYQPNLVPTNFNRGILVASVVLPGHLVVYGVTFSNTNAAARVLLAFDSALLPADGVVPLFGQSCATGTGFQWTWGSRGREFTQGLALCNSTTLSSKTIGTADSLIDVQYDLIEDGGTYISAES